MIPSQEERHLFGKKRIIFSQNQCATTIITNIQMITYLNHFSTHIQLAKVSVDFRVVFHGLLVSYDMEFEIKQRSNSLVIFQHGKDRRIQVSHRSV